MARHIAVALLFCSLLLSSVSLASPTARAECDYGDAWADLGNWKRAVTHYQKALKLDPGNLPARLGLTRGLHSLGKGSQREYKLSTDIDPARRVKPILLREKGTAFDRALMIEAREIFQAMARLAPDYLPAQTNMAACLLALGKKDQARKIFRKVAMKSNNSIRARSNLAVLDLLDGNLDQGIGALVKITQEKPVFADAHYNLAQAFIKTGQSHQAQKSLGTYLALDQNSGWARLARDLLKKLQNP